MEFIDNKVKLHFRKLNSDFRCHYGKKKYNADSFSISVVELPLSSSQVRN